MFALDSNTVVHFFKRAGRVADTFQRTPRHELAIPAIVIYEMEVGLARKEYSKRRAAFELFRRHLPILPFDEAAARAAAAIRAELERTGRGIGPMDTLIAGTAVANSATLVTHNTDEFARIRGLRIVDWY